MEQWQSEAEFVLAARKNEAEYIFSEDDTEHSKRKKHDEFQETWGFSDYEILDLNQAIAMFILPRLAYFRTRTDSIPNNLLKNNPNLQEDAAFQAWQKILQTICEGLHMFIEKYPTEFSAYEQELWQKAKKYLFDYFEHLWI